LSQSQGFVCKGNSTNYDEPPREKRQKADGGEMGERGNPERAHMNGYKEENRQKPSEIKIPLPSRNMPFSQPGQPSEPGKHTR